MKLTGNVARMEEMRNAYNILVGKPEGKKPIGRFWRRWEDYYYYFDLRKIWREVVEWFHLAQDRDQWWTAVNTVMNLRVPPNA